MAKKSKVRASAAVLVEGHKAGDEPTADLLRSLLEE